MKHMLTHNERASLYEALNALAAVKEEVDSQQGEEMLARGTEGIEGSLDLRKPLSCFPNESNVEITFSKCVSEQKNNQVFGRRDRTSTDCKFYIHAIRKTRKRIVKCRELHKEGNKLRIFGFKGETIKDALCKDGRFLPFLKNDHWKLISNLDSIVESTQVFSEIEGKLVQTAAEKRSSTKVAAKPTATQNSELEKSNPCVLKEYTVEEYPNLKREMEKIGESLKKEMKRRKNKTALVTLHRPNFGTRQKNSTPLKIIMLLSRLDSVGSLRWDNNGSKGSATCFVITVTVTCRHVINDIVEGAESSKWADIISQGVRVTLGYEELETKDHSCEHAAWFEMSDVTLGYAVLKLKENGRQVPVGLDGITPVPPNGLVFITGHPKGERKSTAAGVLIPHREREETCDGNVRELLPKPDCGPAFIHSTQNSFQEIFHSHDAVMHDTAFSWGSSGSLAFDSHSSLVAALTAGFTDKHPGGNAQIAELGSAVHSSLFDIEQNHKEW
ncbi:LOW QUALITY PROTEIN: serine protease FAM111A [Erethizon dorsatum]